MINQPDSTLVSRLEGFARTTPRAPAVSHGDLRLTYLELNQQADRLALRLAELGVGRGDLVAMYLDRSIEWVVGMLGALKAGAICMPLDPAIPADRFSLAISAGRPAAVVSAVGHRAVGHPLPSRPEGLPPVVTLDASAPSGAGEAPDPRPLPRREELAYAMFTSGSSGAAKIVAAQHSWLALSASRSAAINATTSHDVGSWLGAAGAGIALHEVGGLLWQGAHIVIGDKDVIADPPALRDWLLAQRITQSFVITPVGELLLDLPWPRACALRLLTLGGDRLNTWGPADLPFEVAVSYGSLEAFQITNSCHPWHLRCTPATASEADRQAPPPVGRPIDGVAVHLLADDGLTPAGDGIGEIWIDSDCLSLGYLGDPAQTADRFRPNPFGATGSRIYRSGDAGRLRPDGLLEHHGRIDDIVKIRGHRVELGDAEWALGLHPDVRQVAVVATMDGDQRRLVACFVAEREVAPLELRQHALARLPDWMVPVAYVQLAELPVNTSNKVDRRRLPPADWRRGRPGRRWRAPAPGTETALARLFADLLQADRVGADDHFLELGGDSLLLARLQGRIEQDLHARVEMAALVADPTVSGLARLIAAAPAGDMAPALAPITPRRRGAPPGDVDRLVTAFDHHDPGYTPRTAPRVNSQIRDQQVTWSPAYGGIWILSRYADVRAALADWSTFSSARGVHFPRAEGMPMFSPIDYDPPRQREIRDRMAAPVARETVRGLEPQLRLIASRLLAPVAERGHGDLMAELAQPFAIEVLGLAFGLSAACRDRIREATKAMWTYISTDRHASKFWPAFHALLGEEIDRVRREPDGSYIARLAALRRDGRPLPDEELYSIIVSFCVAGHDNTMNSITRLVHTLAGDPALQLRLRREPALRPAVAEEALRRWCPTDRFTRVTTREVAIAGTVIPAGSRVVLLLDAANRDPEKFTEPDAFDPDRGNSRQHLSFGHGIHHCMGLHLARAEFAAVLDELARLPRFDLDGPSELHFENGRHIMFDRLPVRFRSGEEREP